MVECIKQDCCEQLQAVKTELSNYQLCAEDNLQQLSNLNIKYEKTVNELSTIINIFEYINLVDDYKNLFSIINDMVIGVLGATNSTIFVYDGSQFNVETSNISRKMLKGMDMVSSKFFFPLSRLNETCVFYEKDLQDEYIKSRQIKSAIVVPLKSSEHLLGVIYVEHAKEDYFTMENIKYVNTLAIAIRLALENAQLYAKLEEMAFKDGLTGLNNRMLFNKEIQNSVENHSKYGLPFVLAIINADNFKAVNETYGHICGDKVLCGISEIIKMEVRKDDFICRYSGEEYAIIFKNTCDYERIMERLEVLREKIQKNVVEYENHKIQITCSMGVVCSTAISKTDMAEQLVHKADSALNEAKRGGKNRICLISK